MKRKVYIPNQKKEPYRFIPRRDLFPDAGPIPVNESPSGNSNKQAENTNTEKMQKYNDAELDQTAGSHAKADQDEQVFKPLVEMPKPKETQEIIKQPILPAIPKKQETRQQTNTRRNKPTKSDSRRSAKETFNLNTLVLILVGGVILWPALKKSQPALVKSIETGIKGILGNPQSLHILQAIGPYLEDSEQDTVYTVTGILEALNTVQGVMDHTYHQKKRQSMILQLPLDPVTKRVEMMKALSPYIPENSRRRYDSVIKTYDAVDRLNRNINIYKNNRVLSAGRKMSTIEVIAEILKVVRPILPGDYQYKADKAVQMLKMAEAMEMTDKISKSMKKEKTAAGKSDSIFGTESSQAENKISGVTDQTNQVIDSLKSLFSDDQKESMDIFMKMAQLLAQPDDGKTGSEAEDNDNTDIK